MGSKTPSAPPPPNPFQTAAAQTGSNIQTSIANTVGQNADEVGPLGGVNYRQIGSHEVVDELGRSHQVPRWERNTYLSTPQLQLQKQQEDIGWHLNNMALTQTQKLNQHLANPVDATGLPNSPTSVGPDNFSADRQRVEQALYDRLNPQLDRTRNMLETKLVNQGLARGTEAFNNSMDEAMRQENDARLAITAAGGQEQSRLFADQLQQATFQQTARERALQERLALRNQPINEISTLMRGGQVSMPQFSQFRGGQVDSTPVGQYVYQSADLANRNYQSQLQASAAGQAGMFNALGTAARGAFMFSDRRLKRDVLDTGIRLLNGLKIYSYRYLWSPARRVGLMAQEVAGVKPNAVAMFGPFMAVHYGAATER